MKRIIKKLEDGLYSMEYKGDYKLGDFLDQGGSFGCSTISARTEEGDALFGRNFDWGTCTR